jgi:diaminopimelate epimerase
LKVEFTKMSGAGNDFIVIDNRTAFVKDGAALAKKICDRHWCVGADGLILLEPSEKASYRMMYYNADGSYGGMCGNGGRCIAMYAFRNTIASSNHSFEALEYLYTASINSEIVSICMKNPVSLKMNQHLLCGKKKILYHSIDTGAPHIVIDIKGLGNKTKLEEFDVHRWGKILRWNKKFEPPGTNVNFIEKAEDNSIHLRTFERGVEAETLACGTGSIASAIIAYKKWKLNTPITVIPTSKVPLIVDFDEVGKNIYSVKLKGPATITFTGSVNV